MSAMASCSVAGADADVKISTSRLMLTPRRDPARERPVTGAGPHRR
ncbi:MAG: hypothetical protein LC777_14070 [Actinobacteria bacterium]|nr:hypothetical protein [Actinomycetota bacterium]